ncbi:MAG: hypothetical protein ACLU38_03935 [Dysosmobacter sp.]
MWPVRIAAAGKAGDARRRRGDLPPAGHGTRLCAVCVWVLDKLN